MPRVGGTFVKSPEELHNVIATSFVFASRRLFGPVAGVELFCRSLRKEMTFRGHSLNATVFNQAAQPLWVNRDVLIRLTGAEWRRLSERKRCRNTFPHCCSLCSNSAPLHLYRSWFFLFSDGMCFYSAFQFSAGKMLSAQMPDGCTIQLSALRVKCVCVLRRINTNASPGWHQTWWGFFESLFHLWIENKTKELTK